MLQCAWTSFYHKTTPHAAVTIFKLGDLSTDMHDVPPIDLPLCDSCARIYRQDVEPNPANRIEIEIPAAQAIVLKERVLS